MKPPCTPPQQCWSRAGGRVLFAEAESYPCASSDIRSGKLPPEKWPEVLPQEALAVIRKKSALRQLVALEVEMPLRIKSCCWPFKGR